MKSKPGAIIIEGHVQGLSNTRSLGEMGIPVYVVDKTNCIARYSKYCKKFFRCPDFISDEFVPFLIELAQKENMKDWVLIPSNDHAVYNISKNKAELEKYYKIITPGIETIDKIYDKAKLLDLAEKCNVSYPKTQYFISEKGVISENIPFPILTKGRNGLTFYKTVGKKAFLSNSEIELRQQLKLISQKTAIENTFSQEVIPFDGSNKTISFTAFCVNGEIKSHWIGEKLREHPIRFGTATFARSIECEELFEPSQRLLKEIKYTGVCEVEFLFDPRDKKYKLIEINARTWLWVGLAKACGINYALYIYNFVNQIETNYPATYKTNFYWINPFTDISFAIIAIVQGKLNVFTFVKSLFYGNKISSVFHKGDNKPGLIYFLNLFSFFKTR
ncbi:MAG: hypothetical protein RBT49_00415 [Bacteroidales bacterium]|jgi:predicted ATP-grasp superfamily ATP-dependent carboligase|nr:hypothetical protein [Bacteroidales bacterium]